jgi:hypothetical protein
MTTFTNNTSEAIIIVVLHSLNYFLDPKVQNTGFNEGLQTYHIHLLVVLSVFSTSTGVPRLLLHGRRLLAASDQIGRDGAVLRGRQ